MTDTNHTPLVRADWGFSQTSQLRWRPTRDVYCIAFAPDDEAGMVVVRGLPGNVGTYVITPSSPWLGFIPSGQCTLEFAPVFQGDIVASVAFKHRLSLLLFHERVVVSEQRAPVTRDLVMNATGTGAAQYLILPTAGRKRIQVHAFITDAGANTTDFSITQIVALQGVPYVVFTGSPSYSRTNITGSKVIVWSPDLRAITSDTLGAGEVGQSTELDQNHFVRVDVNPDTGGSAFVHMEAWD